MAKLICTLEACVDCIAFDANGDIPEERPDIATEIKNHLDLKPNQHLASASGLDSDGEYHRDNAGNPIDTDHPDFESWSEDWFSWRPCECCGSPLGGNRNRLSILES